MANAKKKSSKKAKKEKSKSIYNIKISHIPYISKFAKQLYYLGVDISKHLDSVKLEEDKIKKIKIEKDSFIDKTDAKKLNEVLKDILSASERLLKVEYILYKQMKPVVKKAFGKAAPFPVKLKTLSGFKSILRENTSKDIEEARNYILSSFAYEKVLFDEIPLLFRDIQEATKKLMKLEKKWKGKGGQAKLDMSRMHKAVRDIIHKDIHNLSDEIYELYKMRIETYEYLIDKNRGSGKIKKSELEKEYYKIVSIQSDYQKKFSEHSRELAEIYRGEK